MYADYEMLEQARKLDLIDYATNRLRTRLRTTCWKTMIHDCSVYQQQIAENTAAHIQNLITGWLTCGAGCA